MNLCNSVLPFLNKTIQLSLNVNFLLLPVFMFSSTIDKTSSMFIVIFEWNCSP